MRHPRVEVTDLEARLGTRYTAATLEALKARWPGVRFVWLMGADNLAGFHRWERWDEIMAPRAGRGAGAAGRPAPRRAVAGGAALRALAAAAGTRRGRLPFRDPPAWTLVSGRMLDLSSSELRALGVWRR